MKKNGIIICMICLVLVSCGQKKSVKEHGNVSVNNMIDLKNKIKSDICDESGQDDYKWGGGIVENSKFIFYTSKNQLIQINKESHEKIIMKQWKNDNRISLYCTESELYYIKNMSQVYSLEIENGNQRLLCDSEMLKKAGYRMPEICGMQVYSGHIYLELCGLEVIECGLNGSIGVRIAYDVRSGAFYNHAFFYRQRSSNDIYRFDLTSKKENVIRKRKYRERVQYDEIFSQNNKLYYQLEGAIYLYNESGKDVKVVDDSGMYVHGKDGINYIKTEGKTERLYKLDTNIKQVFSQKIHEVKTAKDYIEEARIINHMLFYKKDLSGHGNKYEILLLK